MQGVGLAPLAGHCKPDRLSQCPRAGGEWSDIGDSLSDSHRALINVDDVEVFCALFSVCRGPCCTQQTGRLIVTACTGVGRSNHG